MKDVNIQLLEYAIPPPEKIWTTSLLAFFLKHGQRPDEVKQVRRAPRLLVCNIVLHVNMYYISSS